MAICVLSALTVPAAAQILDIGTDGNVRVYSGPMKATTEGISPLKPPPARPRPATAIAIAIEGAGRRHNLSPNLLAAVAWQESRMRQGVTSAKGARGVMQLMPSTAQALGVDAGEITQNVDGGAAYLQLLLNKFGGDVIKTLAAYNAGPEAVMRYGGVPPFPETRAYVNAVLDRLANEENTR